MADRRPTSELLAAYVDGVGELAIEERRRVERYLADPAARADEAATRELLDQLRALPAEPEAVDWAAMERAIHAEVGDDVPRRSWLYRWRFALPALGLAVAGAIVLLALRAREPADDVSPIAFELAPVVTEPSHPLLFEQLDDRVTVYIDGADLELALDDRLDDDLDDLTFSERDVDDLPVDEASLGFLEPADLAWLDELDDDALARAEQALDAQATPHGGS